MFDCFIWIEGFFALECLAPDTLMEKIIHYCSVDDSLLDLLLNSIHKTATKF